MGTAQKDHYEWVWVHPQNVSSEFAVLFGDRVIRTDNAKTLVCNDEGKQFWVPSTDIVKSMHATSQTGVDDMITLGDLQEYTILRNLQQRYANQQIYTYIGSMLIAINPYQQLSIFTSRDITLYRNRKLHELPPHIYAISNNAYQQMHRNRGNQCVVISGESGAGKTESTKLILQYMAAISGKKSWIEQQIIDANPIMEAFGNAKTIRNDNSSRFGKYIEIGFDQVGSIQGAKIEHYLLEKSRIVRQNVEERNYHIFYYLLAGLSQRDLQQLQLLPNQSYRYMGQGMSGQDDGRQFRHMRAAMTVLSFSEEEVWCIFSLLAAILHLGNLEITASLHANFDASQVNDAPNVGRVAKLLQVSEEALTEALTQKTMFVYGEHVVMTLSQDAAIEGRDSFAKSLYGHIFEFLVRHINQTIEKSLSKSINSIGILDIFGFENFYSNSFEQLCINYANENLQQFFVKNIFKMEQAEYENEGIKWVHIAFKDNQDMLDLIGMKPMNIMSLIDEESRFPKGTDQTMLHKLHKQHGTRSIYVKPKSGMEPFFGVHHYAGIVMYNTEGFLEKNRDSFSFDLSSLVANSANKLLKNIYPIELPIDTVKKQTTLCHKFRNSLEQLMQTLSSSYPFFIRCIKPNENKSPNHFNKELCVRQLRYAGMMETARIRRAGYPIRHTFKEFVQRYRVLLPQGVYPKPTDYRQVTCEICSKVLPENTDYQCGRQKVFLKDVDDALLEAARARVVLNSIKTLQRGFRRVLAARRERRRRQEVLRKQDEARRRKHELDAATNIQRTWRVHKQSQDFYIIRHGMHRLGACIASRLLTYRFVILRKTIVGLQAHCRGLLARNKFYQRLVKHREIQRSRILVEQKLKAGIPQHILKYHRQQEINNMPRVNPHKLNGFGDIETPNRLVDDVFGFLNDADITGPRTTSVREKSLMFEREFRLRKNIPSKLLSRPVNYYEAMPDTTRL